MLSVLLSLLVAVLIFRTMSNQLLALTDANLDERASVLQDRVRAGEARLDDGGFQFAQLLASDGTVLENSAGTPHGTVLYDVASLGSPEDGTPRYTTTRVSFIDSRIRSAARLVDGPNGDSRIVVAATRLDAVDDSRRRLLLWLAVATPLAAAGVAGIGFWLIRASLGPVRAMSRRAMSIDPTVASNQIDGPAGDDEFSELAEAFNGLLDRIDQARARERNFVADVSHELRTPFSILRGELELARADGNLEPDIDRTFASAIEEIDRMIDLTERLLHDARASAGQAAYHPAPTDLRALVDRLVVSLPRIGNEHVVIDTSRIADCTFNVDSGAVTQILTNLIVNALDHADTTVRVSAGHDEDGPLIKVGDDGDGFAPDLVGQQFERYRSASGPQQGPLRSGFGLGLAIASSIARNGGGSIEATQDPDLGGALVIIRLPDRAVMTT